MEQKKKKKQIGKKRQLIIPTFTDPLIYSGARKAFYKITGKFYLPCSICINSGNYYHV